ncbi:MAG: lysine--tRNA ligase [Alphaproteobacteria bacterium]|nr:lysine--tRNA ligase [Alphaproteobacteria bacterium]
MSQRDAAEQSKAWVYDEARKVVARAEKLGRNEVIFETGYGPSGLPHIGTFGEVARTTMVRQAFHLLAPEKKSRLICFSDDMDGLRKVPDNIPNGEMLTPHLEKPLTSVPDPFGEYDSFAAHNNARLQAFLDSFEFDYEFVSATQRYQSGVFDATLLKVLENYQAVLDIILPTLGEERRQSYSPFLPICPDTGKVLMVAIEPVDAAAGVVAYTHPESGARVETNVTGGACKLQWKADWAMRWAALEVDYEMAGKDLSESVKLSSRITKALGHTPPEGFSYELFLDENGEKISKSKGNGLTIEEWLTYAPQESLSLYMFQAPRKAKRLYFDVIPKAVDEYITFVDKFSAMETAQQLTNPAFHIHNGHVPDGASPVSFALLINLVSASNAENKRVLWGFIDTYAPGTTAETHPFLNRLTDYALAYYRDFVAPNKTYRAASAEEKTALDNLLARLQTLPKTADGETIQTEVYATGMAHFEENLRGWFQALYEVLLGQSQGPRFGSFAALYGLEKTCALIEAGRDGKLLSD